jgi:4-alpha-glucanotransferase
VAYTGTHDNDTARGWYASAPEEMRNFALRYLGCERSAQSVCPGRQARETAQSNFAWELIRAIWASVAVFALAPMQDLLNLGTEARMNYPSRLGGNWEWRMNENALSGELWGKIRELNYLYQR